MFGSEAIIALLTLTVLEIVLGIDNLIFLSILVDRLPESQRAKARQIGLFLAMCMRIGLLLSLSWLMKLTEPFATIGSFDVTGKNLILLVGGLFLLAKSTHEIHDCVEVHSEEATVMNTKSSAFAWVILQITVIDIIFSLDSVITAIGLADQVQIMILAIVISMIVMMLAAKSISEFIHRHPTMKVLALSFLILVGTALIGEALSFHIPKGYLYFAMAFSFGVECLNIRMAKKPKTAS